MLYKRIKEQAMPVNRRMLFKVNNGRLLDPITKEGKTSATNLAVVSL